MPRILVITSRFGIIGRQGYRGSAAVDIGNGGIVDRRCGARNKKMLGDETICEFHFRAKTLALSTRRKLVLKHYIRRYISPVLSLWIFERKVWRHLSKACHLYEVCPIKEAL